MTPFFIMCTVVNENERELSIMIYYIDAQMQELYHHQMRGNKKYKKYEIIDRNIFFAVTQ